MSEVYQRSLEAFPYSVDLWTYYCTYLAERLADPTLVRRFAFPLAKILLELSLFYSCMHSIPFSKFPSFRGFADRLVGTQVDRCVCELT